MQSTLPILTVLTGIAVFGVLLAGVWNLARKQSDPALSQRLMRWRVGLQLLAIILIVLTLWAMR